MKILVTGAAGFIGSNLAKYLLDNNYDVVGIDNFNDYYNPKIKEFNIQSFKENPKVQALSSGHLRQRNTKNGVCGKSKYGCCCTFGCLGGSYLLCRKSLYLC